MFIELNKPHLVLPCAGTTARRSHRILMVTKREAENSEDKEFVGQLELGFNKLSNNINPMIAAARNYAGQATSTSAQQGFLSANSKILESVAVIKEALSDKCLKYFFF